MTEQQINKEIAKSNTKIAVLETKLEAVMKAFDDFNDKLDKLPTMIRTEIKQVVDNCRELQNTKKAEAPAPKTAVSGWIASIAMGLALAAKHGGLW
jgi:vacuolar-type H+-ATPase subunit E/Vma4